MGAVFVVEPGRGRSRIPIGAWSVGRTRSSPRRCGSREPRSGGAGACTARAARIAAGGRAMGRCPIRRASTGSRSPLPTSRRSCLPASPRASSSPSSRARARLVGQEECRAPVEARAADVRVGPLPSDRARTACSRVDRRALLLLGHRVTEVAAAPLHPRSSPRPPRRRRSPAPHRWAGRSSGRAVSPTGSGKDCTSPAASRPKTANAPACKCSCGRRTSSGDGCCSTGSATNAFSTSPMRASSSRTTTASSGEPRSPSTGSSSASSRSSTRRRSRMARTGVTSCGCRLTRGRHERRLPGASASIGQASTRWLMQT